MATSEHYYRGHVSDGVIVLDGGVTLPDGTSVRIEALSGEAGPREGAPASDLATLFEEIDDEVGPVDGPRDWSAEADHYLYGTPKRKLTRDG